MVYLGWGDGDVIEKHNLIRRILTRSRLTGTPRQNLMLKLLADPAFFKARAQAYYKGTRARVGRAKRITRPPARTFALDPFEQRG